MSSEWIDTTLGEFIRLQRGHDLTSSEQVAGNVPVMGSAGHNGWHNQAKSKGPGVVIGRSGASMGRVHFSDVDFWPHNTCLYVTDFLGNNPKYVYYFLQTLDLASYNSGSAQASLNRNLIYSIPVRKPARDIQDEIARIIGALDDRIALLRDINATLEAIAQALFKSWFVDFDPVQANAGTQAPSLPAEIQALFPSRLVESPQGLIPEGWEVGCIGDVVSVKGGYAFKSADFQDTGLPVIKIKNIVGDGAVDVTDVQKVSETVASKAKRFALQSGDILMAMTGATIGKVGVFVSENDEPAYLNQRVAKFENKSPEQKNTWLAFIAFSNAFMAEQIVNAASGSAQPNISSAGIESVRLVVPSNKKVLKAFNDLVEPLFAGWINNQKTIKTLANLRDTLLPRLISGQLRLPEAEAALAEVAL